MKSSALLPRIAAVALLLVAMAVPTAHAETQQQAPAGAAAGAEATDAPSAAERRAADSKFEQEKLDQGAFAKEEREAKGNGESARESSGGSTLRMIFGLAVVLGAIYGLHWLLKRWGQSRLQGVSGMSGVIDVVATTNLAQGRALHLVRIGPELVLVGATEQSITRLGDVDATTMGATAANAGKGEFQSMLSGAMYGSQPGVPAGMGGAGSANEPFVKRFIDNLRMTTAR